jgi:hypothetical protein
MPNTTLRADAQSLPIDPAEIENDLRRERFEAAYREFLAARADLYALHADDDDTEAYNARSRREELAEAALIATRAPGSWALFQKWEIVEGTLAKEVDAGQSLYPLTILALAALKADVLAIGLKAEGSR